MTEVLNEELNFGRYSSGMGIDNTSGAQRRLAWINEIPLAVSDFKNGIYSIAGASKVATDLWVENTDWANWTPATDIVPGTGYTTGIRSGATFGQGPVSTPALTAAINVSQGNIIVCDYQLIGGTGGAMTADITLNPVNLPAYVYDIDWVDHPGVAGTALGAWPNPGAWIVTTPSTYGSHKVAFAYDGTHMAYSLDGNPVVTVMHNTTLPPGTPYCIEAYVVGGTGSASATIRSVVWYSYSGNSDSLRAKSI